MQIHEIMRRRRTNEGILSGIANSLANKATSSLAGATGVDISKSITTPSAAPGQAHKIGAQLSQGLINSTAKDAAKQWQRTEASLAAEIGTTDPNSPQWQSVGGKKEEALDQLINQRLLQNSIPGGYKGLPGYVKSTPQMTQPATDLVREIDQAKAKIMANNGKANMTETFTALVKAGFSAQNMVQTMGPNRTSGVEFGPEINRMQQLLATNKMTAQQMNLTPNQIGDLQKALGQTKQGLNLFAAIVGNLPGAQTAAANEPQAAKAAE